MTADPLRFFFDFVDPLSYLTVRALRDLDALDGVTWIGVELRPPPMPLVGREHPDVSERWALAESHAEEAAVDFDPPDLVPWSRKAHELALHGEEKGAGIELKMRIFDAYVLDGDDIGRVDVLVGIAEELGLDRTETKAVLDVDRFEPEIERALARAHDGSVTRLPTLLAGERRLEGFQNRTVLGTFLRT